MTGLRAVPGPAVGDGLARRDLVLAAVVGIGLSRLVEPPAVWLVAVLLVAALVVGGLQVLADESAEGLGGGLSSRDGVSRRESLPSRDSLPGREGLGIPVEALILPAVATFASVGAVRIMPFGLWLVPAMAAVALLVGRCLAIESRIAVDRGSLSDDDRRAVLATVVLVAFLGFVGVAAMVPGGLSLDASGASGGPGMLGGPGASLDGWLLAGADGVMAFLLGYRAATLRVVTVRVAAWSAVMYGAAVAIGAVAMQAAVLPPLLGPALLTLVFYLWGVFHASSSDSRRPSGWLRETLMLVVLGIVVVTWSLLSPK